MNDTFDPYYEWLAIPPHVRPPHHYSLLGIELFESNSNVIANAADRQMSHVRSFQSGPRGQYSQRLLNELATARHCLLDPKKKSVYDDRLESLGITAPNAHDDDGFESAPDGTVFGEYFLLDLLGKGGTGQVFKARHRTLDRMVALKILSHESMQSEKVVARFRRKVRILARIRHPNSVEAYDAGQRDGTHFLVMEFVDGQELAALTGQFHPLPANYVANYVAQAAAGLACAHAHQVCHRNVKPRNILVDRKGVVKVIGLGLAKDDLRGDHEKDTSLTKTGSMLGTLDYMAPEQIVDSSTVDHRADIYGLGCTMYVVLTGRLPYREKSPLKKALAHRKAPIPQIPALRPDVPDSLQRVFEKMVAKTPEARYQSMEEVIAALQAVGPDLTRPNAATAPPQRPSDLEQFMSWVSQRDADGDRPRETWTDQPPPLQ